MVKFKNQSFDELFQKLFPLKIVSREEIPEPKNLMSSETLDLDEYMVLANHMIDLCKKKKGVGLSAVQCGLPIKFFIASEDGQAFRCFVDMTYVGHEPLIDSLEGCLSILDAEGQPKRFLLKRYSSITVKGLEVFAQRCPVEKAEVDFKAHGFFCVVLQHEIDHHEGKLISDIGQEVEIVS